MSSPLLSSKATSAGGGKMGRRTAASTMLDELRYQLDTAIPAVASFLLYRIPWLVSLAFVGRIGPDALAAAALATTLCNVTGMSLGVGLSAAMTTLAGQAKGELMAEGERLLLRKEGGRPRGCDDGGGAEAAVDSGADEIDEEKKDDGEEAGMLTEEASALLPKQLHASRRIEVMYKSLSIDVNLDSSLVEGEVAADAIAPPLMPLTYLYRGIFVQLVLVVPVGIWWLVGVKPVLIHLGQGAQLSAMTEQYLRILTPGLWSYGLVTTLVTWLQSIGMADVPAYAALVGLAMHVPFNVLFIHILGWDYLGAAAATVMFQFTQFVLIAAYLFGTSWGRARVLESTGAAAVGYVKLTFWREARLAVRSVSGIVQYLSLGLPGIIVISEWWASEVAIFLSGRLQPHPSYALDGMTIYQTLNSFCFMLPVGISVAGGARVGQFLGASDGDGARVAAKVCVCGAAALGAVTGLALYLTPHSLLPSIFTTDTDVIEEAGRTIPLLLVYVFADGIQFALGGIVKGCGRQCMLMPIVLLAYWVVGLPLGYYLSFVKHDGYMCNDNFFCGIVGLVGGMTTGTWVHMILLALTVAFAFDWQAEARKAQERLSKEKSKAGHRVDGGEECVSNC